MTATEEASVGNVSMVGIDPAKPVFELHGAAADRPVRFRQKLRREKLLEFLTSKAACVVAMKACARAHYWNRETDRPGQEVRLFDIIEADSARLREVEGVGPIRAARITAAWAEQKVVREIMVSYLQATLEALAIGHLQYRRDDLMPWAFKPAAN